MRRALSLALIAFATLFGASRAQGVQTGGPCTAQPSFTCATLTVPLDRRGVTPGKLELAYAVESGEAPGGTVLFLTGGPGQPAVPYVNRIKTTLGAAFRGYRLVLLDQRGTGANALQCPQLQREMGSTDLAVPTKAAVTSCAEKLGAERRFFSTADTVEDIEALRAALGVQKLVLDGVSYGTFVAERYALAHPQRVAKLVLDSVVAHDGSGLALETANMHRVAAVLGPTAAKDLARVVKRYSDGPELLNALVTMSVADPRYPGVKGALRTAARGDSAALDSLLERWQPDHGTPAEALSQGLHASTLCLDTPMPWGDSTTALRKRAPALKRAVARLKQSAVYPFDRATAGGNGMVKTCLWWPPTPAPPRTTRSLPSVPVLLLAGDRDLSTPLAWARREATRAPQARLVIVTGAGHSVQLRAASDAGRQAVADFLQR